jgi:hypothetical protein
MKPLAPLNHACFEVAMADLPGLAKEALPVPVSVHFEEIVEEAVAAGKMPEHYPVRFAPRHSLYGSTLDFLRLEGLLRTATRMPTPQQGWRSLPRAY